MCAFMCVCVSVSTLFNHHEVFTLYRNDFGKRKKIIIVISGRIYRSPNHPTPLQSICSSSSSSPSLFVSLPSAISLNGAVRDRPTKRTAETIGSLLQHAMSRISRLSPGRVVLGDCFYTEFSKIHNVHKFHLIPMIFYAVFASRVPKDCMSIHRYIYL